MNLKYYEVYPMILGILEFRILKTLVLRTFYPKWFVLGTLELGAFS